MYVTFNKRLRTRIMHAVHTARMGNSSTQLKRNKNITSYEIVLFFFIVVYQYHTMGKSDLCINTVVLMPARS